ncbi:hypothetical protein M9979_08025 [Sphingomonas sp. RP10(2022)]|uniref:Uncharacterized protein n=1 Tax=Sphingomonas liriopis TaxID=2949094 RepID=A0A9X2KQR3_9SPHN|nr:hypothetical protein [Sphingomonas liriopis]MCP3734816.1 hypothetical protein [Sphingomonas liriopis]
MATRTDHETPDGGEGTEPGYAAWKRAKIERGLTQSRDRSAMIPVEQVWRDLKLER